MNHRLLLMLLIRSGLVSLEKKQQVGQRVISSGCEASLTAGPCSTLHAVSQTGASEFIKETEISPSHQAHAQLWLTEL